MKLLLRALVLTCAASVWAQSPVAEIRVTGEHRMASGDTPEFAKQFALLDGTRKAMEEAVNRLNAAAEVKALQLKPNHIDAFVAGILEAQEQASQPASTGEGGVYRVDLLLRLDTPTAVRRIIGLRKDQDAVNQLVEIWKQMQELHRQLGGAAANGRTLEERQLTLTTLRVKYLAAQISAALAKTEETLVSARAASAAGRTRAKELADAALAMAPNVPDAHYAMGDVLVDLNQAEEAEAEYRKALSGNPDSSSGHIKLASALRLEGNLPEVIAELREAIRIDPNSAAAHTELGAIFAAQGNNSEASSEYHEALRLDPDFIDAHNNLAIALARQQKIPEAVAEFREIVRIDPDSALGYYNLGIALADMDKDDESAAAFREVVRINPNHYNARFDLADLFRLEGKFDESVRQFREYIRLAPDTPQNQRNIRRAKDFIQAHENR